MPRKKTGIPLDVAGLRVEKETMRLVFLRGTEEVGFLDWSGDAIRFEGWLDWSARALLHYLKAISAGVEK